MDQRPSIAKRVDHLLGLATVLAEIVVAQKIQQLNKKDAAHSLLAERLRRHTDRGFTLKARYKRKHVMKKLDKINYAYGASTAAFSAAVDACRAMVNSLDKPDGVSCSSIATHERMMHVQILIFHEQAAQVLCAMQEIRSSIELVQKCEPDPCFPEILKPRDEEVSEEEEEEEEYKKKEEEAKQGEAAANT
jgi:hypothetical protein